MKIRNIVLDFMKGEDVKILLFGSRARIDRTPYSDVDIAILPKGKEGDIQKKITLLKDYLEESNIPYKGEIINLSTASENFKKQVLKKGVVWKN